VKALYALYDDGHAAQRAVNGLRAAGVEDAEITVITAQPMEEFEFSHIGRETWMGWIALAGGIIGLAFATWLARFTELAWPLQTGNMPIVSWWPNLIIMFELTMLGAIVSTVITVIVSAGLARRRPALYDPEVTDGKILVGIETADADRAKQLERALLVAPGARIKTI
jgi:Alternative complex III, ActD subunit